MQNGQCAMAYLDGSLTLQLLLQKHLAAKEIGRAEILDTPDIACCESVS